MRNLPPKQIKFNIFCDPEFIFIEFIPIQQSETKQKKEFQYNTTIVNKQTHSNFQLIATINNPSPLHFNYAIFEPLNIFNESSSLLNGWYLHDDIQNNGRLTRLRRVDVL